jgi:hypothetical protein
MAAALQRELRYGSSEFRAASAWVQGQPVPPRTSALASSIIRDPSVIRVLISILRLPVINLRACREDIAAWPEVPFGPFTRRQPARAVLYVTCDASGKPLAFAGTALFGQFAVLFVLKSHLGRQPAASWARYQLHTFLALDLGRAGVEYLLVASALRESPGNQYFQHLLGYHARNLRITGA